MNIFRIVPEDFFKPLTSKYKAEYFDCLEMIYETYSNDPGQSRESAV